jgi:hypothetical protein
MAPRGETGVGYDPFRANTAKTVEEGTPPCLRIHKMRQMERRRVK